MPNRIRPVCPDCSHAMRPVYRLTPRHAFVQEQDAFVCCGNFAIGRKKPKYFGK